MNRDVMFGFMLGFLAMCGVWIVMIILLRTLDACK